MDNIRITRQQLAAFIPDPNTLREFERLIASLIQIAEEADAALNGAQAAQNTADSAQAQIDSAVSRIDVIEATAYPSELSHIGW